MKEEFWVLKLATSFVGDEAVIREEERGYFVKVQNH